MLFALKRHRLFQSSFLWEPMQWGSFLDTTSLVCPTSSVKKTTWDKSILFTTFSVSEKDRFLVFLPLCWIYSKDWTTENHGVLGNQFSENFKPFLASNLENWKKPRRFTGKCKKNAVNCIGKLQTMMKTLHC